LSRHYICIITHVSTKGPRISDRDEALLGHNDDASVLPRIALKNRLDHGEVAKKAFQSLDALAQRVYVPTYSVKRHRCLRLCDDQVPEIRLGRLVVRALTLILPGF